MMIMKGSGGEAKATSTGVFDIRVLKGKLNHPDTLLRRISPCFPHIPNDRRVQNNLESEPQSSTVVGCLLVRAACLLQQESPRQVLEEEALKIWIQVSKLTDGLEMIAETSLVEAGEAYMFQSRKLGAGPSYCCGLPGLENMAEQAHLHLESGLVELSELEKLGILSSDRVRRIIMIRSKFEFRLKRRGAVVEDFLSYIEKEISFDVELRDRLQTLALRNVDPLLASCFMRHVYSIYRRALSKFSGRIDIWTQFLQLAMSNGDSNIFTRGSAKALRLYPRVASLWILSARFEFYSKGNIETARSIMQKALSLNRESLELWEFLFSLEIIYAENVLERQEILGVRCKTASEHTVYTEMALVVLDEALKALGDHKPSEYSVVNFLTNALKVTRRLESLPNTISSILEEHFGEDPGFIKKLSNSWMEVGTPEAAQKCLSIVQSYFQKFPSGDNLEFCIRFLLELSERLGLDSQEIVDVIWAKLDQMISFSKESCILEPAVLNLWQDIIKSSKSLENSNSSSFQEENPGEASPSLPAASSHKIKKALAAASKGMCDLTNCTVAAMIVAWSFETDKVRTRGITKLCLKIFSNLNYHIDDTFPECLQTLKKVIAADDIRSFCNLLSQKRLLSDLFYRSWALFEMSLSPVNALRIRSLLRKAIAMNPKVRDNWDTLIAFEKSQHQYLEANRLEAEFRKCHN